MTKKEFIEQELISFVKANPAENMIPSAIAEHFLDLTFTEETDGKKTYEPTDIKFYTTDKEQLSYILSGALYGSPWFGADYRDEDKPLANPDDCFEDKLADILLKGGKITIYETDEYNPDEDAPDAEWNHEISLADIEKGLQIVQQKYPRFWVDLVEENIDLWGYDAILQCAIFGELVFG